MQQLEYRANFIVGIVVECTYLISKLLYVLIVYQAGSEVSGISAAEVKLFIGTFMLVTAVYTAFFMNNFYSLSGLIRNGELDMLIVKPVSLQFYTTLRTVNLSIPIPNIIAGLYLLCTSWKEAGIAVNLQNVIIYLLVLFSGILMSYSVFLLPNILSFWVVKTDAVVEISDKLWDFNNMPMKIYPVCLQRILVFVFSVFFVTNYPVMAVLRTMSVYDIIWVLAGPVLFFFLVRLVWRVSIKQYSSAGG